MGPGKALNASSGHLDLTLMGNSDSSWKAAQGPLPETPTTHFLPPLKPQPSPCSASLSKLRLIREESGAG